MKLKNLSINKKKFLSLSMAIISLHTAKGLGEIISYDNVGATLSNGQTARIYFSTGNTLDDYTYISYDNNVGYVKNTDINYYEFDTNIEYTEVIGKRYINTNTYVYSEPEFNDNKIIFNVEKNEEVELIAKNLDNWYAIKINNKTGFINGMYLNEFINEIICAKITGNNVNIRNMPSMDSEIIGFCDITDKFRIIEELDSWYKIEYLGKEAYVSKKYAISISSNDTILNYQKIVYVKNDTMFYSDTNDNIISSIPKYQNAFVIDTCDDYYKVMIDGVEGYLRKDDTISLSKNCIIIDLSRQILKVYHNNEEVYRTHIISGRKSMQTNIGCFKIGHKVKGYQLTPTNYVNYWIQFDGNIGIHDATWQKDKYFSEVARDAYENYQKGKGLTYPSKHGSHGCNNLTLEDAINVYNLINKGDNVLVIGPNNLIKNRILGKIIYDYIASLYQDDNHQKVKKLV